MNPTGDEIVDLRRTYERDTLDEARAAADPFAQFAAWFADARAAGLLEPNAMTVATSGPAGRPSARIVLLRGWDGRGFVFFTNYESQKGNEISATPFAALLFYWDVLERQVRIEGAAERLDPPESDAYFERRPRGHRLSAWASPQSRPIASRDALAHAMDEADRRFSGVDVPRPPYWGGYRVVPDRIEFWQGRPNRVHDRLIYLPDGTGAWTRLRLAP